MTSVKVVKYFIKSSPVGELHEVLTDIGKVLGSEEFLTKPEVKDSLRDYYESHKMHLQLPNGQNVIVSAQGRQEPIVKYVQTGALTQTAAPAKKGGLFDGEDEDEYGAEKVEEVQQEPEPVVEQQQSVEEFVYYDPVQLVKFSFDPITLEAKVEEEYVDSVSSKLDSSVNALRVDIIQAMRNYLNRLFRKGTTEYSVFSNADGSEIRIEISCHNLNFKSFWGGEWLSTWVVNTSAQTVSGSIKVHNHYFEQGNIQFNLNKDFPSTSLKTWGGKQIIDHIQKTETNYQDGLEDMYSEVSEKLLKGMRRIIPITRQKFDWSRPNLL